MCRVCAVVLTTVPGCAERSSKAGARPAVPEPAAMPANRSSCYVASGRYSVPQTSSQQYGVEKDPDSEKPSSVSANVPVMPGRVPAS